MKKLIYSIFGCLAFTTASAQTTLWQTVQASPDHDTLELAILTAGLDGTLDDPNIDFTLFAPTDAAFAQFFADNGNMAASTLLNDPNLGDILLHHVIGSNVPSTALVNNTEATTLTDLDVSIFTMPSPMIDSSNVTVPNVPCTNGILHMIDYPLLPTYDDVTEVVTTSEDHTILLQALINANLVGALQDLNSAFTVFAPTDAAFAQFLSDAGIDSTTLMNDPDLAAVLLHHVVSGTVTSGMLSNGEVNTLSGLDVSVDLSMGVMIDDAEVTLADIMADNGVVHVIDYVLLPTYDDVTEVVTTSANHTILLQALINANLVGILQDQNSDFTVFAPTDAAFAQFLTDAGIDSTTLMNASNLSNILLHHVVAGTVLSTDLSNGNVTTLNGTDVTVDLSMGVMIDDAEVTLADIIADNGVVHVIDGVLSLPDASSVEENMNEYSVYPNPFVNEVSVNAEENTVYELFSISGQLIKTGTVQGGTIDFSALESGVYLLRLENSQAVRVNKI